MNLIAGFIGKNKDFELIEIQEKVRQAEQNFNYANQEHIDAAIYELKATEEKFNAMLREKRGEEDVSKRSN